jgi:hypothetical protein
LFATEYLEVEVKAAAQDSKMAEKREPLLRRSSESLFGSFRSGNRESVSLSFTAPAPGHRLQRFQKVDKLAICKRSQDPAVIGSDKASAIRDQTVHRLADGRMKVSAGIDSIVFGKTGNVADL